MTAWMDPFPAMVPEVTITSLGTGGGSEVDCPELQWWFVAPTVDTGHSAAWYDRATGELTRVRRAQSLEDLPGGRTRFGIDEWSRPAGGDAPSHRWIELVGRLTSERAEFCEVTMDGSTIGPDDPAFADWSGGGPRRFVDDGPGSTVTDVVDLTVGTRMIRCLQVFASATVDGTEDIGQPFIELASGRTVAYWQYRPASFDADADTWFADHPGDDITVDGIRLQRRNCTGRDDVCLTEYALREG